MSHHYLLETYNLIDKRIEQLQGSHDDKVANIQESQHFKGRMTALWELKEFLYCNLNCKLPRRLQKKFGAQ